MKDNTILIENIVEQILDKTFLGNEWSMLVVFTIVAIFSIVGSMISTYFVTKTQNLAIRRDFQKALGDLEIETKSIKKIEEDITHNYLKSREISKIKREKIEEIYLALSKEAFFYISFLTENIGESEITDTDLFNNKVKMLVSLYFPNKLKNELKEYLLNRKKILELMYELDMKNKKRVRVDFTGSTKEVFSLHVQRQLSKFNKSRLNIEDVLIQEMKDLMKVSH